MDWPGDPTAVCIYTKKNQYPIVSYNATWLAFRRIIHNGQTARAWPGNAIPINAWNGERERKLMNFRTGYMRMSECRIIRAKQ